MRVTDVFEQGDLVWFLCDGGYGYPLWAPAIFVAWTTSRATIDLELKGGGWKRLHVAPHNLKSRASADK